jgi:hypothetical protein
MGTTVVSNEEFDLLINKLGKIFEYDKAVLDGGIDHQLKEARAKAAKSELMDILTSLKEYKLNKCKDYA